jgi:hypothetical protein
MPVRWVVLDRTDVDEDDDGYPEDNYDLINIALFGAVLMEDGEPVCPLHTKVISKTVPNGYSPSHADFDTDGDFVIDFVDAKIDYTRVESYRYKTGYPRDVVESNDTAYDNQPSVTYLLGEIPVLPDSNGNILVSSGETLSLDVFSVFPETASYGTDCEMGYDRENQNSCDSYFEIQTSSDMDYVISTVDPEGNPLVSSDYSINSNEVQSIID